MRTGLPGELLTFYNTRDFHNYKTGLYYRSQFLQKFLAMIFHVKKTRCKNTRTSPRGHGGPRRTRESTRWTLERHTTGPQRPYPRPSHTTTLWCRSESARWVSFATFTTSFRNSKKKNAGIAPWKLSLPVASHHVSQFSERSYVEVPQTKSLLTQASIMHGRRTHHLARLHTGSKCACGATIFSYSSR